MCVCVCGRGEGGGGRLWDFLSGVGRQRIIEVYAVSISLCWKTTPLMNMVFHVMLLNLVLFICFGGWVRRGDRRVEHKSPILSTILLLMFTELTENINTFLLLAIPLKKIKSPT